MNRSDRKGTYVALPLCADQTTRTKDGNIKLGRKALLQQGGSISRTIPSNHFDKSLSQSGHYLCRQAERTQTETKQQVSQITSLADVHSCVEFGKSLQRASTSLYSVECTQIKRQKSSPWVVLPFSQRLPQYSHRNSIARSMNQEDAGCDLFLGSAAMAGGRLLEASAMDPGFDQGRRTCRTPIVHISAKLVVVGAWTEILFPCKISRSCHEICP